jgi:hypothetical protein
VLGGLQVVVVSVIIRWLVGYGAVVRGTGQDDSP